MRPARDRIALKRSDPFEIADLAGVNAAQLNLSVPTCQV